MGDGERNVWRVRIETPAGPRAAYVRARTAADAAVVFGDVIRAEHGLAAGAETGALIGDVRVRAAPEAPADQVIGG